MGSGGWTSGSCIQKSKSPNSLAFAAANWICFTIVKPLKVFCQLYPEVLCAGDSLKGLVVEEVAGGDLVPIFSSDSQLVAFLFVFFGLLLFFFFFSFFYNCIVPMGFLP